MNNDWWTRYRIEVERLTKACDAHGPDRVCDYCRAETWGTQVLAG